MKQRVCESFCTKPSKDVQSAFARGNNSRKTDEKGGTLSTKRHEQISTLRRVKMTVRTL